VTGLNDAFIAAPIVEGEVICVDKRGRRFDELNSVAGKLIPDDVDLAPNHVFDTKQKILDLNIVFDRVRTPVNSPFTEPGEVQDRFAEGFRWNRAGVDADASNDAAAFNNRNALP
jgi:hypothetical protein